MSEENKPSEAQLKYANKLKEDLGEEGNKAVVEILKEIGKEQTSDLKELDRGEMSKIIQRLKTASGLENKEFKPANKGSFEDKMENYVNFEDLLKEAHERYDNRLNIETSLIETSNTDMIIFQSTIKISATEDGPEQIFKAYGDATKENVNSIVAKHILRVAETRSLVRCLRFCLGIGMTAREELGGEK